MIYICSPTSGRPTAEFTISILRASQELRSARLQHMIGIVPGISPIQLARYEAVTMFLECRDATHLMFIDDDMVFSASDIMRLKAAEKPVIGAMCPRKTIEPGYCVRPSTNPVTEGELVSVDAVGAGFVMIARGVIEALVRKHVMVSVAPGVRRWPFFECSVNEKGEYESEDYTFCAKVRDAGFTVWAHTAVSIGHVGTFVYQGRHTSAQKVALLQGGWSE